MNVRKLICPLVDAREIRLPIDWLLTNGCNPKLGRGRTRLGTVGHPPTGRAAPRLRRRRKRGSGAWLYRGRLANLCRLLVAEVHIRPGRLGCQSSTCYGSNCESPGPNESPKPHGLHSSRLERSKMSAYSVPIEKLALTGSFRATDRLRGKPYVERMGREISIPRSPLRALG